MNWRIGLGALLSAAVLTACTTTSTDNEPEPTPSASTEKGSPTEAPDPTNEAPEPAEGGPSSEAPEPTQEPPASAVTVPPCEDLLDEEDLDSHFGNDTHGFVPLDIPSWGPPAEQLLDQDLRSIIDQADNPVACSWGIPDSDAAFTFNITPLDDDLVSTLESELTSGTYTPVPIPNSVPGYGFERHDFFTGIHAISDNVWFEFSAGPESTEPGAELLEIVIERTTN